MLRKNSFLEDFDIDRLDKQTGTVKLIKVDEDGGDDFGKVRDQLIKHVDETVQEIEERHLVIEEFTIRKSVARELDEGEPFNAKDCKTWDQHVINKYHLTNLHKTDNYDGLIVIAAVTDEMVPTETRERFPQVDHQQYAFALKQSLTHEFMLVRGDGRIANLSFETGRKSESSSLGIVLLAYKFKKPLAIPRYEDAKLEPGYAYCDMAANTKKVSVEDWVKKQLDTINSILAEVEENAFKKLVGLTIGYSHTCPIRSKDGTNKLDPCVPETWRNAGSIESIWNNEYKKKGYHKLVALTVISKETVKNGDWSTYAKNAITKLNSKLVDEYGDLFTECQYNEGEKWETAAVLYVAYKVKEYQPIKIQDVKEGHTFTIHTNINDEKEHLKRVKLIKQDIENTLEAVKKDTGKEIDGFMIGKAEATLNDIPVGGICEPGRSKSASKRSRDLLTKLKDLESQFDYCLVLAVITRETIENITEDKVKYAEKLQREVSEQLKQDEKWMGKYQEHQQQVRNIAGVIIMFMALKLQRDQKTDTK